MAYELKSARHLAALQFYYHFTTIDGIDLPHFDVFCFFHDRVTVY